MSRFTLRILGAVVSELFPKTKFAVFQCWGANMAIESQIVNYP